MNAGAPRAPAPPGRTRAAALAEPGFGFRFVAPLALGSTLNPINSTMIATALVPIAADFRISAAEAGWLIAGLYLASAVAQPALGHLADVLGPRRIFLASLVLVAGAGLLGSLAPTFGSLVAARVLLGIGTSGAYPSAMRLFRMQADRLGAEPPRVAMGYLALAAQSTAAVGLALGGLLTGAFGWHAIFAVNIPLALATAALILLWVPRDPPRTVSISRLLAGLDPVGITLFSAMLLGAMAVVMDLGRPAWWALLGAAASGAALVVHSARHPQPFIDVRMLARNLPLALTFVRAGALSTIVFSFVYGFAQWLQGVAGRTSAEAGLLLLPISLTAALASQIGARSRGIRAPFIVGMAAALAGSLCLLLLDAATPALAMIALGVLLGLPQGLFSTATQAAVYIQAPAGEIGTAAGLQRTAQYLGAIVATSLLGLVYGQRATDHGFHLLAAIMAALSAALLISTIVDRTIPRGRVG
jgi:MFS family permease